MDRLLNSTVIRITGTHQVGSVGHRKYHVVINWTSLTHWGRHFPDENFKWIFLNENIWITIKFSMKFVCKDPINNIPALVQIMAWRADQVTSHYLNHRWLVYWGIYASLGLNEIKGPRLVHDCKKYQSTAWNYGAYTAIGYILRVEGEIDVRVDRKPHCQIATISFGPSGSQNK